MIVNAYVSEGPCHALWQTLLRAGVQVPADVDMSLRQQLEDMGFDANK